MKEAHVLMYLKHMYSCVPNLWRETQVKVCPLIHSPLTAIFIFTAVSFLQCDNVCQILNLLPGLFFSKHFIMEVSAILIFFFLQKYLFGCARS